MNDQQSLSKPEGDNASERNRCLARVYFIILGWPSPEEKQTEPVTDFLDGYGGLGSNSVEHSLDEECSTLYPSPNFSKLESLASLRKVRRD